MYFHAISRRLFFSPDAGIHQHPYLSTYLQYIHMYICVVKKYDRNGIQEDIWGILWSRSQGQMRVSEGEWVREAKEHVCRVLCCVVCAEGQQPAGVNKRTASSLALQDHSLPNQASKARIHGSTLQDPASHFPQSPFSALQQSIPEAHTLLKVRISQHQNRRGPRRSMAQPAP